MRKDAAGRGKRTMSETDCRICHGTKRINVLNVWRIQRRYRINGGDASEAIGGSSDDLPFIVLENACPDCCGESACDEAHRELERRMGGNPWSPETYEGEGQV